MHHFSQPIGKPIGQNAQQKKELVMVDDIDLNAPVSSLDFEELMRLMDLLKPLHEESSTETLGSLVLRWGRANYFGEPTCKCDESSKIEVS